MNRRSNLEVDDAEYRRVKCFIIGKARRYQLTTVEVSDRLVVGFGTEQLADLIQDVAEAGYTLVLKSHLGYSAKIASERNSANNPTRFGTDPHSPPGGRHPQGPHWAGEEAGGPRR